MYGIRLGIGKYAVDGANVRLLLVALLVFVAESALGASTEYQWKYLNNSGVTAYVEEEISANGGAFGGTANTGNISNGAYGRTGTGGQDTSRYLCCYTSLSARYRWKDVGTGTWYPSVSGWVGTNSLTPQPPYFAQVLQIIPASYTNHVFAGLSITNTGGLFDGAYRAIWKTNDGSGNMIEARRDDYVLNPNEPGTFPASTNLFGPGVGYQVEVWGPGDLDNDFVPVLVASGSSSGTVEGTSAGQAGTYVGTVTRKDVFEAMPQFTPTTTNSIVADRQNALGIVEAIRDLGQGLSRRLGGTNQQGASNAVQFVASDGSGVDGHSGPDIGDYNGAVDVGEALLGTNSTSIADMMPILSGTVSTSSVSPWTVSWGATTFNFNPLADSSVMTLAVWIRRAFLFVLALALLFYCLHELSSGIKASGAFTQAQGANVGVEVLGTGFQTTWVTGLVVAAICILLLIGLITFFTSWLLSQTGMLSAIGANPFSTSDTAIGLGLNLANAFFPLPEAVLYAGTGLAFTAAWTALLATKSIIIRSLPS